MDCLPVHRHPPPASNTRSQPTSSARQPVCLLLSSSLRHWQQGTVYRYCSHLGPCSFVHDFALDLSRTLACRPRKHMTSRARTWPSGKTGRDLPRVTQRDLDRPCARSREAGIAWETPCSIGSSHRLECKPLDSESWDTSDCSERGLWREDALRYKRNNK
jgi:hypothetical protein